MLSSEKISVIIPVYNLEDLVEHTLDSLCAQTYKNLEIIAVDDGSVDNSWQVLCDYAKNDSRVKPVHQENGGVTSARLNGVSHATGEWIGFVDGDDLVDADMFEVLYNNAVKYGAQISHCGYKMVLGTKRVDYYYNTGVVVEQDNLKGLCDIVSGAQIEPGLWNKLYHKSLFEGIESKMDFTIRNFEDLLMNYYLFKNSQKSVFEDVCKYNYMVRKGSAATSEFNLHKYYGPRTVHQIIAEDENCDEVHQIAFAKYIMFLVRTTTWKMSTELIQESRQLLKNNLKKIITAKGLTLKEKLMAFTTLYFSSVYKFVRYVYVKVTKIDHKYDLEQ